jgi:predicted dehydrogenase
MQKLVELISGGAVGAVRMLEAKFNFRGSPDPQSRLLNPALAGGGLLDVGVYDVAFAQHVFGTVPDEIVSLPSIGGTGVDEQAAMVFRYTDGALAVLSCAVRTSTPQTAAVYGTDGWIEIPHMFWQPDRIILHRGGEAEEFTFNRLGNGYSFEARHAGECIRKGSRESGIIPHSLSADVMKTMDELRSQWNLKYPFE